jgi:primase-polymerase (primpol)-like protein
VKPGPLPDPSIPAIAALAALGARFVDWTWETRKGKPAKPPLRVSGGYASVTDPTSWSSFDEALAAARDKGLGVGFVLDHGQDSIAGVDLDGCRDPDLVRAIS